MEQQSDSGLNTVTLAVPATVEGDRLDENNALILHRTPERGFIEGDTIVWEHPDGSQSELYVEGISEQRDVKVILRIDGTPGHRVQYADFRLRFRDQKVAYPVIPDRAKELIEAPVVE